MKTGLITSTTYQNHDTGPGHPEQIARVTVVNENFKKLNINLKRDKTKILSSVNDQRLKNNPVKISKKDISLIFDHIY